jgi:hypothetical protein
MIDRAVRFIEPFTTRTATTTTTDIEIPVTEILGRIFIQTSRPPPLLYWYCSLFSVMALYLPRLTVLVTIEAERPGTLNLRKFRKTPWNSAFWRLLGGHIQKKSLVDSRIT